jgi:hypothetical protein
LLESIVPLLTSRVGGHAEHRNDEITTRRRSRWRGNHLRW